MKNWNTGEPIIDQVTGEPVIDPATGDYVEVAPGKIWIHPITGKRYEGDDVVNAIWWRVNTHLGEDLLDRSVGVDYNGVVFSAAGVTGLAESEVVTAALTTPGAAAIVSVVLSVDKRVAAMEMRVRRADGGVIEAALQAGG